MLFNKNKKSFLSTYQKKRNSRKKKLQNLELRTHFACNEVRVQVPVPPEAKSWRIIPAKRTTTGNRENFDEAGCGVLLKSECLR